jgi:hypothetical protein
MNTHLEDNNKKKADNQPIKKKEKRNSSKFPIYIKF